jgi:A/G-specific adenine glycosylase
VSRDGHTARSRLGLLAGLFEPPTTPLAAGSTVDDRLAACHETVATTLSISAAELESMITSERHFDAITHIFSHINMTYHIVHIGISSATLPHASGGVWLDEHGVESANIGTGVKKVWKAVHGSWGRFEVGTTSLVTAGARKRGAPSGVQAKTKGRQTTAKASKRLVTEETNGKMVRKIMMPVMPRRDQEGAGA